MGYYANDLYRRRLDDKEESVHLLFDCPSLQGADVLAARFL